jgi:uncharacterized protein with NRDE domain
MCLFLLANKIHPNYKLIIAANRDEFYNRPVEAAHFWQSFPHLLAGRDLKAGGTWLGITLTGRIAAITNFRDLKNIRDNAPSRGELTLDFLINNNSPYEYYKTLKDKAANYNGFNLVFGIKNDLYFFSNHTNEFNKLDAGLYGLSNCLLDTPWPKVVKVKEEFKKIINENELEAKTFQMLRDEIKPPDELLPDTGVGLELERVLSSVFIKTAVYGTRSSTLITINIDDEVQFIERTYNKETNSFSDVSFNFNLIE